VPDGYSFSGIGTLLFAEEGQPMLPGAAPRRITRRG